MKCSPICPWGRSSRSVQLPFAWLSVVLLIMVAGAGCTRSSSRTGPALGAWKSLPEGPSPRLGHSVVWTGQQMLMWGGQVIQGATYRSDGAVFDPLSNRWSQIPSGPLEPRGDQVAVWTGSRMLVWGGGVEGSKTGTESFADGASFDPSTRRWSRLARSPLEPRTLHTGVWTGSQLLIWGGVRAAGEEEEESGKTQEELGGRLRNDGAVYDPSSNRWSEMSPAPLTPRAGHVAVWTGREMLVWGGATLQEGAVAFGDGAAYDPTRDTWRSIGVAPIHPGARFTAVWTGRQMLVWGGPQGEGAAYDPALNQWTKLPKSPLPTIDTPTSVWTGRLMLLWGAPEIQPSPAQPIAQGAAYDPARNQWISLPSAPSVPGQGQTALWTGTEMLVWGGFAGTGPFSSGATFSLGTSQK